MSRVIKVHFGVLEKGTTKLFHPNFRDFLSPGRFAARYEPSEEKEQKGA